MPRSPSGPSRLASYEAGWEAINRLVREGGSWSGHERKCFYVNAGDGTFVNASATSGLDFTEDGRAFAVLDLDRDGDPDLVLKNRTGPQVRVLRNDLPPRGGRVSFRLEGRRANRDAIGARITVRAGGRVRTRSLKCGEGFLSQNSAWLDFAFPPQPPRGGGNAFPGEERVEAVEVRWPGSGRQVFRDLPLGRRWRIVEGEEPRGEEFLPASKPGAPAAAPAEAAETGMREAWLLAELEPPDVAFESLDGKPVRPADFQGRELLLSFQSPHCGLCALEVAEWTSRREEIAATDLRVLQVEVEEASGADASTREAAAAARALARASPGAFMIARAGPRALTAYGVLSHEALRWPKEMSVPMSVLLDAAGRVVKLYRGPVRWGRLARDLALLRQAVDPSRLGLPFPGTFHTGGPQRDHFRLGIGYFEAGLHDLARRAFRRAIEVRPGDADSLFNLGVALIEPGERGLEPDPRSRKEARASFEKAADLRPDFADAHANLGVVLARTGDLAGAEARFAEALRLRPGHAETLLNLGSARLAGGKPDGALEAFQSAARAEPALPAARKKLGEAYRRLGRRAEAVDAFKEAIRLDPDDAEARSNLGVLLAESGRLPDAARELEAAVRLRPAHAPAWNNLGLVQERSGLDQEARRSFQKAIDADPRLPEPYLSLARSLKRAGDAPAALKVLRPLLDAHPDHPEARALLDTLDGGR